MSSPEDSSRSRKNLLINGRRVLILDLIEAGLLEPGQELIFERPRLGERYLAVVTENGRLRLDDGQEFTSPSAAGSAATGARALHSWSAWRVDRNGPSLDRLRQQFLESLANQQEPFVSAWRDELVLGGVVAHWSALKDARERADAGTPDELSVRELLKRWGASERDREVIEQIEADLGNHGLTTVPDFRAVGLDTMVKMVVLPGPDETEAPAEAGQPEAREVLHFATRTSPPGSDEDESHDIGLTLGNVLADDHKLVSVDPSADLNRAITRMSLNDFSQLPVLAGERQLRGAVTWKSIALARQRNAATTLSDAITPAREFPYNTRLLDVLDVLMKEEFVFVRSHDNRVNGIVTAADVVRVYDDMATPFFLIGEVDQELRRLIRNTFDIEDVQQACAPHSSLESFDDMTMGDYLSVLRNRACWDKLGWDLDRADFGEYLGEIRKIRNKVTHFNPDPIPPAAVDRLKNFLTVIRTFDR